MTRIINGVIVGKNDESSSSSSSSVVEEGSIKLYGYTIPNYYCFIFIGLSMLMLGMKGLFLSGGVLGLGYFLSNSNNGSSSYQSSNRNNGRSGGARIMGVSDLPKPPTSC
jgi:hypothetical protein